MRNNNMELTSLSAPLPPTHKTLRLDRAKTAAVLKSLLVGADVANLSSVKVDQLEAARFIQKQAKILRFVSISAEFPTLAVLVEQIYYTAFDTALLRLRPDYLKFRELLSAESAGFKSEIGTTKAL